MILVLSWSFPQFVSFSNVKNTTTKRALKFFYLLCLHVLERVTEREERERERDRLASHPLIYFSNAHK